MGAAYVSMALMCPLQHVSRIEEFEPPMGTEQEARVVGGVGTIAVDGQAMAIMSCVRVVVVLWVGAMTLGFLVVGGDLRLPRWCLPSRLV